MTCAFHGSGSKFGMAPHQEIFVLWRLATLPSLMLLSKSEQFCPLTAGLYVVRSHDIFCVLDFGSTKTIKSQDYDRIVKIEHNRVSQENGNFIFCVNEIGRNGIFLTVELLLLAGAVNKRCRTFSR